jgi:NDP-sugar pyrophosphorylase family protein
MNRNNPFPGMNPFLERYWSDVHTKLVAYIGDAILGCNVNLGAGTKLANLKLKGDEVRYKHPITNALTSSGLRKFSAIMGDESQTGCNSVLSPGTILMPNTAVLPCVHYHGTLLKGFAR